MSDPQMPPLPDDMTEEQLREAYEAEIKKVRVEHVLLENVVTIINMGMRRTGLMPGTEDEQDSAQVQLAVESVRSQMPLIEAIAPDQAEPLKQALSQLQMAFVQITGGAAAGGAAAGTAATPDPAGADAAGTPAAADATDTEIKPGQPGPAQSSGRLWVPGQ